MLFWISTMLIHTITITLVMVGKPDQFCSRPKSFEKPHDGGGITVIMTLRGELCRSACVTLHFCVASFSELGLSALAQQMPAQQVKVGNPGQI